MPPKIKKEQETDEPTVVDLVDDEEPAKYSSTRCTTPARPLTHVKRKLDQSESRGHYGSPAQDDHPRFRPQAGLQGHPYHDLAAPYRQDQYLPAYYANPYGQINPPPHVAAAHFVPPGYNPTPQYSYFKTSKLPQGTPVLPPQRSDMQYGYLEGESQYGYREITSAPRTYHTPSPYRPTQQGSYLESFQRRGGPPSPYRPQTQYQYAQVRPQFHEYNDTASHHRASTAPPSPATPPHSDSHLRYHNYEAYGRQADPTPRASQGFQSIRPYAYDYYAYEQVFTPPRPTYEDHHPVTPSKTNYNRMPERPVKAKNQYTGYMPACKNHTEDHYKVAPVEMGNAEEECDESFGYYESNQVGYISEVEDIDEPPKKKRGKPPVSTKGTAKEAKNFTARRRGAGRGQGSGEGIVGRRGSASRGKNRSRGADALLDDGEGGIQDSEYKDVGRMGYFEDPEEDPEEQWLPQ